MAEVIGTMKKLYNQVLKKEDGKKRGIMYLLDHLADPEALEKTDISREDVAKYV